MICLADFSAYRQPQRRMTGYEQMKPAPSPFPADTAAAMAYVPVQLDTTEYDAAEALEKGTLFAVLNKPFEGMCRR